MELLNLWDLILSGVIRGTSFTEILCAEAASGVCNAGDQYRCRDQRACDLGKY